MNLKSIAALAATLIATSAWAEQPADQKCGAGTCGKKEAGARADGKKPPAARDGTATKKDTACSKKDAGCSKTEGGCSKKDAAPKADAAASKP